jgi:hypothetical protein
MVQLQSGIGMKGGPDNPLARSGNKDTLYRIRGTIEGHQRLVRLRQPDERGHCRLQPHAGRRESHRVRSRQTGDQDGSSANGTSMSYPCGRREIVAREERMGVADLSRRTSA